MLSLEPRAQQGLRTKQLCNYHFCFNYFYVYSQYWTHDFTPNPFTWREEVQFVIEPIGSKHWKKLPQHLLVDVMCSSKYKEIQHTPRVVHCAPPFDRVRPLVQKREGAHPWLKWMNQEVSQLEWVKKLDLLQGSHASHFLIRFFQVDHHGVEDKVLFACYKQES